MVAWGEQHQAEWEWPSSLGPRWKRFWTVRTVRMDLRVWRVACFVSARISHGDLYLIIWYELPSLLRTVDPTLWRCCERVNAGVDERRIDRKDMSCASWEEVVKLSS